VIEVATTVDELLSCVRLYNVVLPWAALHRHEVAWLETGRSQVHAHWLVVRDDAGEPAGSGSRRSRTRAVALAVAGAVAGRA
jgi:hypothetical protein